MHAPRMLVVAVFLASGTAVAAPSPSSSACGQRPDIRNLMTVNKYTQSGLDKLTEKELTQLNAWLAQYTRSICGSNSTQATASETKNNGKSSFGKSQEEVNTTSRIISHINGVFHGWTGNTRFRLTNGQTWVQAGPGYYQTTIKNPKVIIKKLLIGYILEVNGKEVFVRRIQ